MKKFILPVTMLVSGILLGASIPEAGAHPDSECPACECPEPPPCPELVIDMEPDDAEAAESVQRALEAMEAVEAYEKKAAPKSR